MSRWRMPAWWAAPRASHIWTVTRRTSSHGAGPWSASLAWSEPDGQVLHGQEGQALLGLAGVVHGDHVGVPRQRADGLALGLEPALGVLVGGVDVGQHLEGDRAPQLGLVGPVHDREAAATQLALDLVPGDRHASLGEARSVTHLVTLPSVRGDATWRPDHGRDPLPRSGIAGSAGRPRPELVRRAPTPWLEAGLGAEEGGDGLAVGLALAGPHDLAHEEAGELALGLGVAGAELLPLARRGRR